MFHLQHRYYGESLPFGSREEAYRNANTLGYFSSAQALADYAELIRSLKTNFSADNCPVIVIGGSYGGSKCLQSSNCAIESRVGEMIQNKAFTDVNRAQGPLLMHNIYEMRRLS